MTSRKHVRSQMKKNLKGFARAFQRAEQEAWEGVASMTPFEISVELAKLGVTTTHRAGIETFFQR